MYSGKSLTTHVHVMQNSARCYITTMCVCEFARPLRLLLVISETTQKKTTFDDHLSIIIDDIDYITCNWPPPK